MDFNVPERDDLGAFMMFLGAGIAIILPIVIVIVAYFGELVKYFWFLLGMVGNVFEFYINSLFSWPNGTIGALILTGVIIAIIGFANLDRDSDEVRHRY